VIHLTDVFLRIEMAQVLGRPENFFKNTSKIPRFLAVSCSIGSPEEVPRSGAQSGKFAPHGDD
jgi:hypothetical protein